MSVPNQLFEAALGIASPWHVKGVEFDAERRKLTIGIDFSAGARFPVAGLDAVVPLNHTVIKRLQQLNFFQHECFLEVGTPRVKMPDGGVVLVEPDWFGKLARFAQYLTSHTATPAQIGSVSIHMSPAFIKGVTAHLPKPCSR
jgi:hypothetical protein